VITKPFILAKDLCTYTIIILRHSETLRDHGGFPAVLAERTRPMVPKRPARIPAGRDIRLRPPAVTAEFAALFRDARLVVQPEAGHFPWRDDPTLFVAAVTEFLTGVVRPETDDHAR
jgi:pimeloyl-ACP methyl ester carboxylesterase